MTHAKLHVRRPYGATRATHPSQRARTNVAASERRALTRGAACGGWFKVGATALVIGGALLATSGGPSLSN